MSLLDGFLVGLRGRMLSRDRLFRLATLEFLNGGSKESIVQTFMSCGLSEEEALATYDRIVEASSKVSVRGGVRVRED